MARGDLRAHACALPPRGPLSPRPARACALRPAAARLQRTWKLERVGRDVERHGARRRERPRGGAAARGLRRAADGGLKGMAHGEQVPRQISDERKRRKKKKLSHFRHYESERPAEHTSTRLLAWRRGHHPQDPLQWGGAGARRLGARERCRVDAARRASTGCPRGSQLASAWCAIWPEMGVHSLPGRYTYVRSS